MTQPLLSCRDARIDDEEGGLLVENVSCVTESDRVILIGRWTWLFRALSRAARVTEGHASVHGVDLTTAVPSGTVGVCSYDPPLPADLTVRELLSFSAELLGVPIRAAKKLTESAIELTGLQALSKRPVSTLPIPERRAVLIAHAVLGSPPVLAVDRPLALLEEEPAAFVRAVLERAAEGRRLLVSMDEPGYEGPERRMLDTADEALVLYAGGSVARLNPRNAGPPGRRYLIVTPEDASPLRDALSARNVHVEASLPTDGPGRLVVRLPDDGTTELILRACVELSIPLLGMLPLEGTGELSDAAPLDEPAR